MGINITFKKIMSTLHDICCNKHITQCNCSVNSAKAVVVLLGTNLIALQHVRSKMHVCMLNLFLALISLCPDKNTIIVDTKKEPSFIVLVLCGTTWDSLFLPIIF